MFEITCDHIAELGDEDLRSLVGRLCEAELRRRELAVAAVTWGGDQNAKDGGLDVRVALPPGTAIDGFIPRAATGFQVKKSDMPRKTIIEEMKPHGLIRPSIAALAQESGAYIIVSSNGSTTDSALKNRRDAMAEAMRGEPNADKIALDFIDCGRLATWVRDHPGIILWVREIIGRAIPGWRAYGPWSYTPDINDSDYLLDETARIRTGRRDDADGLSVVEGINRIRSALRQPGHVVRLVGLSGVGKTRLLEALFDDKIGENSLDPALAAYTNIADSPVPQPSGMASDLLAEKRRMILLIDNCSSELHRQLSEIVRVTGSALSLITVEYDIREDKLEGTDVFSLEPSSPDLIEKLLARRFPHISQIDRRRIADAEFSGGNARIALALAGTVGENESIAELNDAELFQRLFYQRHVQDDSLLQKAQACSLVYSFQGNDLHGDNAELPILGDLIGKTVDEMYRGVAELHRRDLLQERGAWRAVLPHAIANRLAAMALQDIPPQKIEALIIKGKSKRLLRSFSRRLGFLDGSKEARAIVTAWLCNDGFLNDILNLNDLGKDIFNNIAPVGPVAVLSALDCTLGPADADTLARSTHFIQLIRSLAYDASLFERATTLLVRFAAIQTDTYANKDASKIVESLCFIYLSGTQATAEQRLAVIDGLLRSRAAKLQALGVKALNAMLKTGNFSSSYVFEFGARSRDHGYFPKTQADIAHWFGSTLKLAEDIAGSDLPVAEQVKNVIATKFQGLWRHAGRCDDLERISRGFAAHGFWRDGWVAARRTLTYEAKGLPSDSLAQLKALEEFLRPKDLVARVRGVVLGDNGRGLDYEDFDDKGKYDFRASEKRILATIEQLGKDVAADSEAFKRLLPELFGDSSRLWAFGRALAQGTDKARELWEALVVQLGISPTANSGVLQGFLAGLEYSSPAEAEAILDHSVENPTLAPLFPYLQASVTIDEKGVARLHRSLSLGLAPINRYEQLAFGRASDRISGQAFRDLILAIAGKPGGGGPAVHLLSMRLYSDSSEKRPPLPELVEAGRKILASFEFSDSERHDHELGSVAEVCLVGKEGENVARRVVRELKKASTDYYSLSVHDYGDLMRALVAIHPVAVLDELFIGDEESVQVGVHFVDSVSHGRNNPLDSVTPETLIAWCDVNSAERYSIIAEAGAVISNEYTQGPLQWMPLAHSLLTNAPEPQTVLKQLVQRLYPSGWSGSWASEMEGRAKLLAELNVGDDAELLKNKADALELMKFEIEKERKSETDRGRRENERFE